MILLGWIEKQNHEKLNDLRNVTEMLPDRERLFTEYDDCQIDWESVLKDISEKFIKKLELLYTDEGKPHFELGPQEERLFLLCDNLIEKLKIMASGQDRIVEIASKNFDNKNKYIEYKNDDGYEVIEYPDKHWSLVLDMDGGYAKLLNDGEMVYSVKQTTGVFKQFLFLWKNVGKIIPYETLYKLAHDDDYGSGDMAARKRKTIKRDFDRISKELDKTNWDIEIRFDDGVALKLL